MWFHFLSISRLLLAFLSCIHNRIWVIKRGKQEYSSRTLGLAWGIISAVMLPIVVVLVCVGWRVLKRRKADARDESDFLTIKSRAIDPDESMKINSDDESIPYKKDLPEDSPEPTEPVQVADSPDTSGFPYGQPYSPPEPPPMGLPLTPQGRRWDGETEIN